MLRTDYVGTEREALAGVGSTSTRGRFTRDAARWFAAWAG